MPCRFQRLVSQGLPEVLDVVCGRFGRVPVEIDARRDEPLSALRRGGGQRGGGRGPVKSPGCDLPAQSGGVRALERRLRVSRPPLFQQDVVPFVEEGQSLARPSAGYGAAPGPTTHVEDRVRQGRCRTTPEYHDRQANGACADDTAVFRYEERSAVDAARPATPRRDTPRLRNAEPAAGLVLPKSPTGSTPRRPSRRSEPSSAYTRAESRTDRLPRSLYWRT